MTTKGYFGQFGGSFVPEPIQALLDELEVTFDKYKDDPEFLAEFRHYLRIIQVAKHRSILQKV